MKNTRFKGLSFIHVLGILIFIGLAWLIIFAETDREKKERLDKSQRPAMAQPKHVILKKDTLLCFKREDWEIMKSNIADKNIQGMKILIDTTKCQALVSNTGVSYLDPVGKNGAEALIQMPSGRVAYVFSIDILP